MLIRLNDFLWIDFLIFPEHFVCKNIKIYLTLKNFFYELKYKITNNKQAIVKIKRTNQINQSFPIQIE